MRLILIVILSLLALSIAATLIGPLVVLGIGASLVYFAYKKLVKRDQSALGIIWWVIVSATGISMFTGALPGFVFIGAIVALVYFVSRKSSLKAQPNVETGSNGSSVFNEYESFEAEWREVTSR